MTLKNVGRWSFWAHWPDWQPQYFGNMAKKKSSGRTKRNQYDEYLAAAYKKTCRDVAVLGFEFATEERQHQFHYALMEHAIHKYILYDGHGFRANVITEWADDLRAVAESFDGKEFRVMLDEEI